MVGTEDGGMQRRTDTRRVKRLKMPNLNAKVWKVSRGSDVPEEGEARAGDGGKEV